jgi:hypothetical protein
MDNVQWKKTARIKDLAFGNWAKLNVGEVLEGKVVDATMTAPQGLYGWQRGIVVELKDKSLKIFQVNCFSKAGKRLDFNLSKTDNIKIGDLIRITHTGMGKSKTPGFKDFPIYSYEFAEQSEPGAKTILQVCDEDFKSGGSAAPEAHEEEEAAGTASPVENASGM